MDERSSILTQDLGQSTNKSFKEKCLRGPWKVISVLLLLTLLTFLSLQFFQDPRSPVVEIPSTTTTQTPLPPFDNLSTPFLKLESPNNPELNADNELIKEGDLTTNQKLSYIGSENYNPALFPGFEYLNPTMLPAESILEIEISSCQVEGNGFTAGLKPYVNLQYLHLTNITLEGSFGRAYLPHLREFKLELKISPSEELAQYKSKEMVKSLLFFDKSLNVPWDVVTNVTNMGVDLELVVDGSRVLLASEEKSEVVLTMTYCDEILGNIRWPFRSLTLGNCTLSMEHVPEGITSLLLGNVGFASGSFPQLVKRSQELEELYGSIPNVALDLNDLSNTVRFLCLSGITLVVPYKTVRPNVTEVVLGGPVISADVATNFHKTFPNLDTIGVFGQSSSTAYQLLDSLFKTRAANLVLEYFPRKNSTEGGWSPIERKVEQTLEAVGVPEGCPNFILTLPTKNPSSRAGTELSEKQTNFFRYTMMGWFRIDSYVKYLRVIDEGRRFMVQNEDGDEDFIGGVGGEVWPLVVPSG